MRESVICFENETTTDIESEQISVVVESEKFYIITDEPTGSLVESVVSFADNVVSTIESEASNVIIEASTFDILTGGAGVSIGPPGLAGKPGQPRFTGHGAPPSVIIGSELDDVYLDLDSGDLYKLA